MTFPRKFGISKKLEAYWTKIVTLEITFRADPRMSREGTTEKIDGRWKFSNLESIAN